MSAFPPVRSAAVPMPQDNIDTDIIYPARFLLITDRQGLGQYAFYDWRFDAEGNPRDDFAMVREPWASAQIIVGGENFGCGSSREHAVWALAALGVRCVIAPGFGEIFFGNCFKNGILPVVASVCDHAALTADAEAGQILEVDLEAAEIRRATGELIGFAIEPSRREALSKGWDEIELIFANHAPAIADFEARQQAAWPWLWTNDKPLEHTPHG